MGQDRRYFNAFVDGIEQPSIRVLQVLVEALARHDYPVCVAAGIALERWTRFTVGDSLSSDATRSVKRANPDDTTGFPRHSLINFMIIE